MDLTELGRRIRDLRKARNFTLEQVASRTSLTRSWLSKVENAKVKPSLTALSGIAAALDVTTADLVRDLDRKPDIHAVRANGRALHFQDDQSGCRCERLSQTSPPMCIEALAIHMPGRACWPGRLEHRGEVFMLVLKGMVRFESADTIHELQAGDCLHLDNAWRLEHRLENPAPHPADLLLVQHHNGR